MVQSPQADPEQGILEKIFNHPPVSQAELGGRLETAHPARLRGLLVEQLRKDSISAEESGIVLAVFENIGVKEARPALEAMVTDAALPLRARSRALAVLLEDDPGSLEALLGRLPERELQPLAEQWISELLGAIQADPRQGEVLAETLEAASDGLRPYLFEQLEAVRRTAGTSAAAAYGRALCRSPLADLHGRMVAAVVEEARPDGVALLEELWRQAPPGPRRRVLHGAVFRARTRHIEPPSGGPPSGYAFVGSCDGQGAFILAGCFENPDGTLSIADLCVRVDAAVRDGFVLPRRHSCEVEALLAEISRDTGIGFARLGLAEAAALVREAAGRTASLGLELPADALPAIQTFERVEGQPAALEVPAAGSRPPTLEELRALLARPEYEPSWFFDHGDLQAAGLELPVAGTDLAEWAVTAAARLDRPSLRIRLSCMARHMARWHRWKGEPALAELCSGAARLTEESFAQSPLTLAMLERSLVPADGERGRETTFDGSMLRQHLKGRFFQDLLAPTGRDLARLDFTEAALVFLEEAFLGLPGERRPREDECVTTAYAIGKVFADFLIAGANGPIEKVISEMDRSLKEHCHLDEAECRRVVAVVLPALGDFIEQHCTECPAACIDRPGADVAELFFAPHHPVGRRHHGSDGD